MLIAFGPEEYQNFVNFGVNTESFIDEVDDGECASIYAPKILDYIPSEKYENFMKNLVKKMRHGCTITIGGTDMYEVAKQLLRGDFSLHDANNIIYGKDIKKLGHYSLNLLTNSLKENGLKIESKYLEGNEMCIKAVRE